MGKRLVITEKPSVARDICAVLGGFVDHGEYQESDRYLVTFAVGHLLELAEPEDYDKSLRAWKIESLPIIPETFKIKPKEGQKKRLDVIKKLGERPDVDGLIDACDAGREGEIIFRRIIEYTGLDQRPHQRLWLQSMTADAIRDAFAHLRPGAELDHLADAAWLRGVGDWLIGMNSTRALTKRLKGRLETGAWSAGRVQTPTLGILVAREREILAHEPRTYWEIEATFQHDGQTWMGRYHDPKGGGGGGEEDDREQRPGRIFERARVDAVLGALGAAGRVPAAEKRRKSKQSPPLPFDLTTLQREANRRFSFSAKRTLQAAQRLYEVHKVLTYPRTDSRYLPSDWGPTLDGVVTALTRDADYTALATKIQAEGPQNLQIVLDGTKVSDHFAIVPTGSEPAETLSGDDARIYDLVVRQFLAALMGPATWALVERTVEVPVASADAATFRTTAKALEIPGFLEALGAEEGDGTTLPPLVPGSDQASGVPVDVAGFHDTEKETRPPARHNESALLRLMETAGQSLDDSELAEAMKGRGLGTPATRADIIERLISTGYVTRIEGKLGPTPKGMRLIDILDRAHVPVLGDPRLTGEWEYKLKQVEAGAIPRQKNLDDLVRFTRDVTKALGGFDHDALYASEPSLGTCPSCGEGQVVETPWGYRCTRNERKENSGCKLFIWKEKNGRYIDRKVATALVRDRKTGPLVGFSDRFGRALEGRIVLEPDVANSPGCQWNMRVEYGDAPEGEGAEVRGGVAFPCPCGDAACEGVIETSLRFICQRVLDGQAKSGPVLPKVVCGRTMEAEEIAGFFAEEGKTPLIEGFISRRNRPFKGMLVRKPTGKHGFEFPERPGRAAADGEDAPAKAGKGKAAAKRPARGKQAEDAPTAKKPARGKKADAEAAPAAKKAGAKAQASGDGEASPKTRKKAAEPGATPTRAKKAAAAPAEAAEPAPKKVRRRAAAEPAEA